MSTLPNTPLKFKEAMIEYILRTQTIGFSKMISPVNLTHMSMFDTGQLEADDCAVYLNEGMDPETTMKSALQDITREARMFEAYKFVLGPDNRELKVEVERLLDEEIEACRIPGLQIMNLTIQQKVAAVAKYRRTKDITALDPPKKIFHVILTTLVSGYGGSTRFATLRFSINTSFSRFLRTLQDETQVCRIPPIDITDPARWGSPKSPRESSPSSSSTNTMQSPTTPAISTLGYVPLIPRPRTPGKTGYTLDDGPWVYRISIGGQVQQAEYTQLADENSYLKMLDTLKDLRIEDPKNNYVVAIMHSAERECQRRWHDMNAQAVEQEKIDQAERREAWRGLDAFGDGDEEDVGEMTFHW